MNLTLVPLALFISCVNVDTARKFTFVFIKTFTKCIELAPNQLKKQIDSTLQYSSRKFYAQVLTPTGSCNTRNNNRSLRPKPVQFAARRQRYINKTTAPSMPVFGMSLSHLTAVHWAKGKVVYCSEPSLKCAKIDSILKWVITDTIPVLFVPHL